MSKKNNDFFLIRWIRRAFFGASNEMAKEMEEKSELEMQREAAVSDVEEIVSPGKQVVRSFMESKLAVCALVLLVAMFITMFVGPVFMPKYYDAYTEVTQTSIAPNMSMMSVPSELKNDIKMIDSYGPFSVGLSNAGKVYVWGSTKIGTTGVDVSEIPEEVLNAKIEMVAAGIDHVIAIDENGKIYGWGYGKLGQYGTEAWQREQGWDINAKSTYMSEELAENGVDLANVKKLACGYQCTAILMNDGTVHLWGNTLTYANFDFFANSTNMYDIDFTLNYIVGIDKNQNAIATGSRGLYDVVRSNVGEASVPIREYLNGRKIVSIEATNTNMALVLDDGSICFAGDFKVDCDKAPVLADGEYFTEVSAGSYHYTGLTNLGNVYSWGENTLDQTEVPKKLSNVDKIYTGSFQSYAVSEDDDLVDAWGLKGYAFGTDTRGADIFQRVIAGGKMTMTVGAVAVIISSIIGIVIGCLAGYFGGKVDILLMRVAEVFSAIPFLPFAMILSAVMGRMTLSETARIFIIMVILGVLSWPGLARLVRGQVLVVRESEYVTAAKAMGVTENRIAFKHILPNVMSVILVNLMLNFGTCMLTESSLSYLGFGVQYPRPTWGNMLNGANNETIINAYWWQWAFPALFLAITTICINLVGDALRDAMDPRVSSEK